ncbi:hypothetical protein V202x_20500 [Gimesia aquarii]|uniref:Uncharacterized protein n=1 Tax=Gimesia aquarii TaxID=2527964 RepID=A0A517WTU5_9PLAN|nr:hypothetical protein V202x_20500 [Gimesia aquarii]
MIAPESNGNTVNQQIVLRSSQRTCDLSGIAKFSMQSKERQFDMPDQLQITGIDTKADRLIHNLLMMLIGACLTSSVFVWSQLL